MLTLIRSTLNRGFQRLPLHFVVAFTVTVAFLVFDLLGAGNLYERDAYDLRLKLRPTEKAHRDIVLVEIDDNSLQAIGAWPWRRSVHAQMVRILKSAGVRAIFFDVLFPENSQYPEDDRDLAAAIREAGNVVLAFHFLSENPPEALFPIPDFLNAAYAIGYANTEPDSDGVVRSIRPAVKLAGQEYFHTSVRLFQSLFSDPADGLAWSRKLTRERMDQRILVNYPGKLSEFSRLPAHFVFDLAQNEDGRERLEKIFNGKVVMFGDTSTGSTDISTTPLEPKTPGLAIQASLVHSFKSMKLMNEVPKYWNHLLIFSLAWLLAWLGKKLRPHWVFAAALVLMALFAVSNFAAFYFLRYVFYFTLPLLAITVVFVLSLFLKYMEVRMESDFLARELQMASKIQQSLLPGAELKLPQLDAGFRCLFYEQVGGDLYDWMDLGNGRVALCLGDVSGKGVPAALYMSRALNELRHQVTSGALPGEILTALNNHLARGETSGMFLTLFFMIIDSHARKIYFTNGGHDPMVYFHAKENKADLITASGGLPIGIMEDQNYETGEIDFAKGDAMLLTSDGIKEQKAPNGEQYGSERLQRILEQCAKGDDTGKMIDAVMADVLTFASGRAPHDDRTLVCVKIL